MNLEAQKPKGDKWVNRLLVPLVISVGVFFGVLFSYLLPLPPNIGPFAVFADRIRNAIILDMVFSTVSISLLVALVIVYLRIYARTGARFALGILVVMMALLLQAIIKNPLVLSFVGRIPGSFGFYLSFADVLSVAAYSIFLYLSLE